MALTELQCGHPARHKQVNPGQARGTFSCHSLQGAWRGWQVQLAGRKAVASLPQPHSQGPQEDWGYQAHQWVSQSLAWRVVGKGCC